MKSIRKFFVGTVFVIICLTGLSGGAFAQTATAPSAGDGSSGNPYQIASIENLYWIAANTAYWSKYYIQNADIDASVTSTWFSGAGWTPIGNATTKFTGSYNGEGHTISGLYIYRLNTEYQGLFGYTNGATIQNVGVTNVNITGYYHAGGLVGYNSSSVVSNSYCTGSMAGQMDYIGGLAGKNYNNSTVSNCYTTCSVSGYQAIGGLIGQIDASTVSNSYSTGSVSGTNYIGGLAGINAGSSTISNSYSTGSVTGSSSTGGLLGLLSSAIVSNSFWDTQTSGKSTSAGGTGKTTAEMKTLATFTDASWDFEGETANGTNNYWDLSGSVNSGYPYLSWQDGSDVSLPVELTSFTAKNQICSILLEWSTASEIENLGFILEKKLIVGANHDLSSDWSQIASYVTDEALNGHGSTSEKHEYQYTDKAVQPGATYLYRLADVDYGGKVTWHKEVEVKVEVQNAQIPEKFGLQPAYPNPFNPSLTIPYGLTEDGQMTLKVYNLHGQLVETLMNTHAFKGTYSYTWQPVNLSAGIYFIRLQSGNRVNLQKVVFVK